jgi:hypothetical protein
VGADAHFQNINLTTPQPMPQRAGMRPQPFAGCASCVIGADRHLSKASSFQIGVFGGLIPSSVTVDQVLGHAGHAAHAVVAGARGEDAAIECQEIN